MTYKILQKVSNSSTTSEYWSFVKVDDTSTTIFTADNTDDLEVKLKSLLQITPITQLKVVSELAFTDDLIFS